MGKICDINGIPVYESEFIDDDKMYKTTNFDEGDYIVVSPKTAKTLLLEMERKNRLAKLEKINGTN